MNLFEKRRTLQHKNPGLGSLWEASHTIPLLNIVPGMVGVCFHEYTLKGCETPGLEIIFENGEYDGFSESDQHVFLNYIGVTLLPYMFSNVIQVMINFKSGTFTSALAEARRLKGQ